MEDNAADDAEENRETDNGIVADGIEEPNVVADTASEAEVSTEEADAEDEAGGKPA